MKFVTRLLLAFIALAFIGKAARAQSATTANSNTSPVSIRTFYLTNVSGVGDQNEIANGLRTMLDPHVKIYAVSSQNAIVVSATPDQIALADKLISDLDRPRKTYRIVYTITDTDGGKRIGVQHFAMILVSGGRTTMKQGSKIPVVTGSYNPGTTNAHTDITYLDIGLNFDASLDESVNGIKLKAKAEQSSIATEKPSAGLQDDPIVRQTVVEGTSILTPGKSLVLGSLDVPGSTRHLDVEVMAEVVK